MYSLFQSTLPHGERPARFVQSVYYHLFQSTLPHGERLKCTWSLIRLNHFNPRSRTGSDPRRIVRSCLVQNFNPRSRTGSDLVLGFFSQAYQFQSTLPHGERRINRLSNFKDLNFNPRSRTGSDHRRKDQRAADFSISIHAPARGATGYSR